MAFVSRKTKRPREAPHYFSSHYIHAGHILIKTAKRRQKYNNKIVRLEKNLADSLELDKKVYLNSFAGLTLTEVFKISCS